MSGRKDGGSAFPITPPVADGSNGHFFPELGMSLRDYFAGQALAALIAKNPLMASWQLAHDAYEIADAMLAERAKAGASP